MNNQKVLIAGAGIGGLTAAIALQRKGCQVTVYEKATALSEIGAGVQLGPNATRPLLALGLGDELARIGSTPERGAVRTAKAGFCIMRPKSSLNKTGFPYYQCHRADLHKILETKARELGVVINLGAQVTSYQHKNGQPQLLMADGSIIDGDLLIGADGIRSKIRDKMMGPDLPVFTGQVAWRGLVDASRLKQRIEPSIFVGPDRHFVTYYVRGGTALNFVAIEERDDWHHESWTEKGDVQKLRQAYADWSPEINNILANVDECYTWALFGRRPLPKWSDGKVCLIGDACHPTLPNMAAGAGMAIEDAYILADIVEHHQTNLAEGLREFYRLRIGRCTKLQEDAKRMSAFVHARTPAEQFFKYAPAAVIARVWPSFAAKRVTWAHDYDATSMVSSRA